MAQRRMFSFRITESARFLKMPLSSQALYFHLCMHADDDGIVEAYRIIKYIETKEDDLNILVAKNFVRVLNDDLVAFVSDWHEHNLIRADRKVDSIYKELLVQVLPEAQIIQPVPRADRPQHEPESRTHLVGRPTKKWDGNGTEMGRHRLGKVSINNVNGTKEDGRKTNEPKTSLHRFPNIERDREEIKLIADDIVAVLGDQHSRPFYTLVAMKIPENVIRQKLAEIKQGGAHSPAKAFTSAMKSYATTTLQKREMSTLTSATQAMFKI